MVTADSDPSSIIKVLSLFFLQNYELSSTQKTITMVNNTALHFEIHEFKSVLHDDYNHRNSSQLRCALALIVINDVEQSETGFDHYSNSCIVVSLVGLIDNAYFLQCFSFLPIEVWLLSVTITILSYFFTFHNLL